MPDHCQKYPESPLAKVKLVTFDFDETLSLDEFEGMGRWKWPETISHLHCYKVLQMMVLISDVVSNLAWACKCLPIVFIIFTHAIHARSFTFVLLFGKTKMVLVIETISYTIHAHHVIDSWVNLVRHLPFATAWANGSVSSISSMWERQGYINMPYMLHNFEQFSQFLSVLTSHESGSRQLIFWTSPCALHKSLPILPLNLYYFVAWGAWFHVKGLFIWFYLHPYLFMGGGFKPPGLFLTCDQANNCFVATRAPSHAQPVTPDMKLQYVEFIVHTEPSMIPAWNTSYGVINTHKRPTTMTLEDGITEK